MVYNYYEFDDYETFYDDSGDHYDSDYDAFYSYDSDDDYEEPDEVMAPAVVQGTVVDGATAAQATQEGHAFRYEVESGPLLNNTR